eukprot:scpid104690/ scgid16078/ 
MLHVCVCCVINVTSLLYGLWVQLFSNKKDTHTCSFCWKSHFSRLSMASSAFTEDDAECSSVLNRKHLTYLLGEALCAPTSLPSLRRQFDKRLLPAICICVAH